METVSLMISAETFARLADRAGVPQSLDTIRQAWRTDQDRKRKAIVNRLA